MKRIHVMNSTCMVLLVLVSGVVQQGWAQANLSSTREVVEEPLSYPPPTEALSRFSPYVGLYEFSGGFMGQDYKGTLQVNPAVKGYYVEWIIEFGMGTIDNHFDRQLRILTTWDRVNQAYRIWRFETNAQEIMGEGRARFDGPNFIMEWDTLSPDGQPGTFRNIVSRNKDGQIIIKSEGELKSGGIEALGVGTGTRRI